MPARMAKLHLEFKFDEVTHPLCSNILPVKLQIDYA